MKKLLLTAAIAALAPISANAAQIVLTPGSVYATSGEYSSNYSADNIFDAQSGTIDETAQDDSYWLYPDNTAGAGTISVDLGAQYRLGSFDFFNTHNAFYNDRGTGIFNLRASNDSTFATSTLVALGTLSAESQGTPLSAQTYNSLSNGLFRYLQFSAYTTAAQTNGGVGYSYSAYGLNELRVFDAPLIGGVPEPTQWTLMIGGFGLVGAASRRRRLAVA